jgi:hypothetical protein
MYRGHPHFLLLQDFVATKKRFTAMDESKWIALTIKFQEILFMLLQNGLRIRLFHCESHEPLGEG